MDVKLRWMIALIIMLSTQLISGDSVVKNLMKGDQGLLIVGQIIEEDDFNFEVIIEHVLQGKELKRIKVEKGFNYSFLNVEPKVHDICLMSLDYDSGSYKIKNGVYKTDCIDYKTLNIIADQTESYAVAVKLFVNSNGRISEFTFKDKSVYYKNLDGTTVVIDVESTAGNESTTNEDYEEEGWLMPVDETYILLVFIFIVIMAISVSNSKK